MLDHRQQPCAQVVQTAQDEVNRLARINSITTITAEVLNALCNYLKSGMAECHGVRGITQQQLESLFRAFGDKMKICSQQHDISTHLEICKNMQSKCEDGLLDLIKIQKNAIIEQKDREQEKERCKQIEWEKFHKNINDKFAEQIALIKGKAAKGTLGMDDDDGVDTGMLKKKASMVDVLRNEKATMQQVLDESEAAIATLKRETETKTAEIRALQMEMQRLSQGEGTPVTPSSLLRSPGGSAPSSPRSREANKKLMETQKNLLEANKRADQAERARREAADDAEDLRQEMADLKGTTRQQLEALRSEVDGAERRESLLQEDYRVVEKKLGKYNEANAKLFDELADLKGNLRVMTRVRPQLDEPDEDMEDIEMAPGELVDQLQWVCVPSARNQSTPPTWYGQFECVFGQNATNADIFDEVKPVLGSAFNGKNATVFAYGQSGSGKTYTLGTAAVTADLEQGGLIPRSWIADREETWDYEVTVEFLEIFADKIYDLISGKKEVGLVTLPVPGKKSTKAHYADCSSETVTSDGMLDVELLQEVLSEGSKLRSTGSTLKNSESSRSHSVLTLRIRGTHRFQRGHDGNPRTTHGVLNLIDLAGSEKFEASGGDAQRRKEGIDINISLSSLKRVIESMANPNPTTHIPFRESTLTKMLEPCMGIGSKVIMLTMVSPLKEDNPETRNTLGFAQTATKAKLQAKKAAAKPAENSNGSSASSSQPPRTPTTTGKTNIPPVRHLQGHAPAPLNTTRTGTAAGRGRVAASPASATTPRTPSQRGSLKSSSSSTASPRLREDSQGKQTLPSRPATSERRSHAPLPTHVSFRERVANAQSSFSSDEETAPAPPRTPRTPTASSSSSSSAAASGGIPRPASKLSRSNAVRRPSTTSGSLKEPLRRS
ncbi:kinesin-domain-containing protein [Apiospora hydei]|uniref:Kinesin-like protein n=1 Tax=Apiospora hydei TaxID=1337664 RepID=A0ABR1WZ70_9PEZI